MKIYLMIAGLIASVYLLIAIVLFVFQRGFLYFPTAKYTHTLTIEQFLNEGEHIDVAVLNKNKENAILYFGGNGESVTHSAPSLAKALSTYTLYLVNYRGYGGSSGKPSERALNCDAQTIYDVVKKRHTTVSVIGRSLGSGVATFLASTRAINKMVLISPYDSIQRIAQDRFPVFPMSVLLKDKYDSVSRIRDIKSTTLVILASHDEIIASTYSDRLIKAFPAQQVVVKTIPGTGHNNLSNTDQYYALLRNFMQ